MNHSPDNSAQAKRSASVLMDFQREVKYLPFSSDLNDTRTESSADIQKNAHFLSGHSSAKQEMAGDSLLCSVEVAQQLQVPLHHSTGLRNGDFN